MGENRNIFRLLLGQPEGKRPLGRPRCGSVDNIKMDVVEIGLGEFDWIDLAHDRYRWTALVNLVMNLRVPQNTGKLPGGCTTGGFSSIAQLYRVS
jgi:hypothetical protein